MKKVIFFILTFIVLVVSTILYSHFIATKGLNVKEYKLVNSDLPNSYYGLKIVHVSDLHYKASFTKDELNNLVNEINKLKPDILVYTGDLIDKNTSLDSNTINVISKAFNSIKTSIGKYIITGDNDNRSEFNKIVDKTDFILLDDSYDVIYKDGLEPIVISGISSSKLDIKKKVESFNDYLDSFNGDLDKKPKFSILLIHEPDFVDSLNVDNYDLILAGHSHNGQVVIPFIGGLIRKENAKKYYKPYYKINDTDFYISGGLGTEDVEFRLFNRPSINLYRLVNS